MPSVHYALVTFNKDKKGLPRGLKKVQFVVRQSRGEYMGCILRKWIDDERLLAKLDRQFHGVAPLFLLILHEGDFTVIGPAPEPMVQEVISASYVPLR